MVRFLLALAVFFSLAPAALADGLHTDAQDRDVAVSVQGGKLVWPGGSLALSNPQAVGEALNPRVDTDGDGVPDPLPGDLCPSTPAQTVDGCPDRDGDGFADASDLCPDVFGTAPDGCPLPAPAPARTEGKVRAFREYRKDMDTYLLDSLNDSVTTDNAVEADHQAFLKRFALARIWMGGSWPGDKVVAQSPRWFPPAIKYADVMVATYRGTLTTDEHYLWDGPLTRPICATLQAPSSTCRQRLYVNYSCDGLTAGCDQYAADLGNPATRKRYVDATSPQGTAAGGVWMDDVNFWLDRVVSNGAGTFVRPWNPRTGAPMTQDDWANGMLQVVKDEKAALPDPLRAVINTVPFHGPGLLNIPQAKEALSWADGLELERGFGDPNISVTSFETVFKPTIDYAHSVGAWVLHDNNIAGGGTDAPTSTTTRDYSLAAYLCLNDGQDYYGNGNMQPGAVWSPKWDLDLGAATSACVKGTDGIYRRTFERGSVTVDPATKIGSIS